MSVTDVARVPWKGRGGGYQSSPNSAMEITATEIYQVTTDNGNDDQFIVLACTSSFNGISLPQQGQPHPTNPFCVVLGRHATQYSETPTAWMVNISYGSGQPRQPEDNPLDRPPIVRWSKDAVQLVVYQAPCGGVVDKDDNVLSTPDEGTTKPLAVTNSADDAFDPPLVDNVYDRVATITQNLPYIPTYIDDLVGATNDDNVQFQGVTFPEGTLMVDPPEISELKIESDVSFYEVTLIVRARRRGWDWKITNQGMQCYDSNGNKVACTNNGVRTSVPVNLDKDGKQLASTKPGDALFVLYKRTRKDFTQLRLPAR